MQKPSHKCSQQPISHMGTQKLTDVVTLEAESSLQTFMYIVTNCLELPSFRGTQLPTRELLCSLQGQDKHRCIEMREHSPKVTQPASGLPVEALLLVGHSPNTRPVHIYILILRKMLMPQVTGYLLTNGMHSCLLQFKRIRSLF